MIPPTHISVQLIDSRHCFYTADKSQEFSWLIFTCWAAGFCSFPSTIWYFYWRPERRGPTGLGLRPASGTGSCEVWSLALGDLYGRSPHPHHNYPHPHHFRSRSQLTTRYSLLASAARPSLPLASLLAPSVDFLNIKLRLIAAVWQPPATFAALRASAGYQASCARPKIIIDW